MNNIVPYNKYAPIYEMQTKDAEQFHNNWVKFVITNIKNKNTTPKIVELACGTGSFTKLLMKKGYVVEGIDRSDGVLKIAKKKGIICHKGDMRKFNLKNKTDVIVCIYDSLNYLQTEKDLKNCFNSVAKNLNKNGMFLFDMNSEHKINNLIPKFNNNYFKSKKFEYICVNSHKPNTWIMNMIIFEKKGNTYARYEEVHIEKAYSLSKIKELLSIAKLELVGIYSDTNFSPIKDDTKRFYFVTKKI